jgi:hypothetical protein
MNAEMRTSCKYKQVVRLFALTPERLVWFVLFSELLLWISDRFQWFSFNEKKGLAVLLALGLLGISMIVFILGFLAAWIYRRRFQFGIRLLLLLTVAVAIPFAWMGVGIEKAKRTRAVVARLESEFECNVSSRESLRVPAFLVDVLGEYFFEDVYRICHPASHFADEDLKLACQLEEMKICLVGGTSITDAGLENIDRLTRLEELELRDTLITDAGLRNLEKMAHLQSLDLEGATVTEAGVQRLRKKLPQCKISW